MIPFDRVGVSRDFHCEAENCVARVTIGYEYEPGTKRIIHFSCNRQHTCTTAKCGHPVANKVEETCAVQ